MPAFNIKIKPGWEAQIKRVRPSQAVRRIVQYRFKQSVDKIYNRLINQSIEESDFYQDLEGGVIGAIFGFTPAMEKTQIANFKNLFKLRSELTFVGDDVTAEIALKKSDINKLVVQYTIRGGEHAGGKVRFKWLSIIINGLAGDEINAMIMENIGVDEYVASQSIAGDLPSGLADKSRSGTALMLLPPDDDMEGLMNLSTNPFLTSKAAASLFRFVIKPHPFIIDDIVRPLYDDFVPLLRRDFSEKLKNIPPIS
jgi:hypothetical protein